MPACFTGIGYYKEGKGFLMLMSLTFHMELHSAAGTVGIVYRQREGKCRLP